VHFVGLFLSLLLKMHGPKNKIELMNVAFECKTYFLFVKHVIINFDSLLQRLKYAVSTKVQVFIFI